MKIAIEIKEPNSDEMLNRNLKGENRNGYYKRFFVFTNYSGPFKEW